MNHEAVDIRFDHSGNVTVLGASDHYHFKSIARECDGFISCAAVSPGLKNFEQTSDKVMKQMRDMLESLDKEKMTAIGKRNAVENEPHYRKKKLSYLNMILKEKQRDLQLINDQNKSLDITLVIQEEQMNKIRRS